MRAHVLGARAVVRPAMVLAILAAMTGLVAQAAAEAPFFYDDLSSAAYYDPGFDPSGRMVGTLTVLAQGWSFPAADDPRQDVSDQDYTQQYRARWNFTLDERSAISVEMKGASKGMVVADDYFMKGEYVYKGAQVPLWVYGGIRVPNETDYLVYGGVETMSYRLSDLFANMASDLPLAYKGYAEIRHDLDDHDPELRLMLLGHTVPDWLVPRLTLAAGLDTYFREGMDPKWYVQGHADYLIRQGFGRLSAIAGYAVDLDRDGEQRLSLGVSVGLF
jgi:hypothetical protein